MSQHIYLRHTELHQNGQAHSKMIPHRFKSKWRLPPERPTTFPHFLPSADPEPRGLWRTHGGAAWRP